MQIIHLFLMIPPTPTRPDITITVGVKHQVTHVVTSTLIHDGVGIPQQPHGELSVEDTQSQEERVSAVAWLTLSLPTVVHF